MNVSITGILRAVNNLSGPLKDKAVRLLNKKFPKQVDSKGNTISPFRKQSDNQAKTQNIVEKQRRYKVGELKGVVKGVGGSAAVLGAYTASDFINDLLGIKKTGKGTLKAEGETGEYRKLPLKDEPPKVVKRPKKKEEKKFNLKTGGKGTAKERLEEIQKEKLAAKQKKLVKGSRGAATGLKMPTADQVGLKKLPTPVRNKMGYMYGGGMAKKPRMSSMDYRKGGLLVISIDMMKKNKKGKKEK